LTGKDFRALMIAPAMPAATGNGLAMRLGMFLEAISSFADVDLVVLPIAGPATEASPLARRLADQTMIIPVAGRADTRFRLLSQLNDDGERLAAFKAYGRGSLAAQVSLPILADLRDAVAGKRYDIVHAGRSYVAEAALAVAGKARLTLDLDEDDAAAYRGMAILARRQGALVRADWLEAEADAADALLGRIADSFSTAFLASPAEIARLRTTVPLMPIEIVRNAISLPRRPARRDDGRTAIFVGSFGYAPNVDGIRWFADRIWPMVRAGMHRDARLAIAGRDPPDAVLALGRRPGIHVLGAVADLAPHYARATVAIAPLRAGGGTRIKILEAAAYGVPVIATTVAASGIGLDRPPAAWLADRPADFAAAMVEALVKPGERSRRARLAGELVARRHDRAALVRDLACRLNPASVSQRTEDPISYSRGDAR
jgi:glycosyltransferase involved in cell wall biosynthesis